MVSLTLSRAMIDDGKSLLAEIDRKLLVDGAFWILAADTNAWHLVLCVKDADTLGPKKIYSAINSILKHQPQFTISLEDISLISPNSPLFRALRVSIHTGPGISEIRFSRNSINDYFIEDALIYRVAG